MKCPYAVNRTIQTQWTYEYDEEGRQCAGKEVSINKASFVDCELTSCGAYQNGKCCYNKRSDD
ncbi:MAG: hypothetical protein KBS62_00235 [Oscillospiraceae bacterium]|nr:hypothetical protein [Candidatus Ruminococcus equi]